jgi:hypothetical protein
MRAKSANIRVSNKVISHNSYHKLIHKNKNQIMSNSKITAEIQVKKKVNCPISGNYILGEAYAKMWLDGFANLFINQKIKQ